MIITIEKSPETIDSVKELALRICLRNPEYQSAFPYIERAWDHAIRHNLRIDTRTGIMRDDRAGILVQPCELEPIGAFDAAQLLIRKVWSIAVRFRNLESGSQ